MIQNKMDFSMHIKNILYYLFGLILLSGCTGSHIGGRTDWSDEYGTLTAGTPIQMQYGHDIDDDTPHNIAVLLPLSGDGAPVGRTIRTSIEMATLQNAPRGLNLSFYDTAQNLSETITNVLASNPEIIIGPVFSNDARTLRDAKSSEIPVLSFTSDATAIGDGVMTMALMPNNGIDTIVQEMKSDNRQKFIVFAPNNNSGHLMAGAAIAASEINNIELIGIFYYDEKNPDSIKSTAEIASMNTARTVAHTRARQVLSDIITNERLTAIERSNLNTQLEKLSKTDALGRVPFDSVLFLGNGDDTKSLASYLRYYNVGANDAKFYGTPMWDGSDITSDFTMTGAKYASLPPIDSEFSTTYEKISGGMANTLAAFGYDATKLAIGMIYSDKSNAAYLLDPSGYIGTNGIFRLNPNGDNERAMRIMELNGTGIAREVKPAPSDFLKPLYNINPHKISAADSMELQTTGIDPDDFIKIPERFQSKYRSKTIGANTSVSTNVTQTAEPIEIISTEENSETLTSSEYKPIKLESVRRSYIDEYEIEE